MCTACFLRTRTKVSKLFKDAASLRDLETGNRKQINASFKLAKLRTYGLQLKYRRMLLVAQRACQHQPPQVKIKSIFQAARADEHQNRRPLWFFPHFPGNNLAISSPPWQSDLPTSVEAAGDTNKYQIQVPLGGVRFGSPAGIGVLPSTMTLFFNAHPCIAKGQATSTAGDTRLRMCCAVTPPSRKFENRKRERKRKEEIKQNPRSKNGKRIT
jgi:hypothetical protein